MSVDLLNSAAPPGQSPGAASGLGAQAAQAAQAKGAMAGFEALLAAFFGDQGPATDGTPGGGAVVAGLVGQTGLGTKATDKAPSSGKTASIAGEGDRSTADAAATDPNALAAQVAAGLILPTPPQILVPTTASGPAADTLTGGPTADPRGLTPAIPETVGSGSGAAKAVQVSAQDIVATTDAGAPAKTPDPALALLDTAGPAPGQKPDLHASAGQPPQASGGQGPDAKPVEAQGLPLPAAVTAAAEPPAPPPLNAAARVTDGAAGKDKPVLSKAIHIEGARTETATLTAIARPGLAPTDPSTGSDGGGASDQRNPSGSSDAEAKPAPVETAAGASDFNPATGTTASTNVAALAHAATLVRGSPQTVANLAAQIAKKLDGRSSRFDVQLDPAGLGKVDVRVEIDSAGKMTAAMNFDNQQAANELRSRSGELQRALEQAGFDMSGGISFDVSGQGGQGGRTPNQAPDSAPVFRGRAFQAVLDGGADPAPQVSSSFAWTSQSGLDIRI